MVLKEQPWVLDEVHSDIETDYMYLLVPWDMREKVFMAASFVLSWANVAFRPCN